MGQSNCPLISSRIAIDNSADWTADGVDFIDQIEATINIDGEGAEGAVCHFKSLIQAVQGTMVGIQGQPRRVWRASIVVMSWLKSV